MSNNTKLVLVVTWGKLSQITCAIFTYCVVSCTVMINLDGAYFKKNKM